jgi:hypothetical protein
LTKRSFIPFGDFLNIKTENKTTEWVFNKLQTIKTFRALPYSLGQTVSDLIDNCIDANANEIIISYYIDGNIPMLIIADNGKGLAEDEIDAKMSFGHERERSNNELGRFGVGLKLSSLVQADTVTMISKKENQPIAIRTIDYNWMVESKKVENFTNLNERLQKNTSLKNLTENMFNNEKDYGTCLILTDWRKSFNMNLASEMKRWNREEEYLKNYLGRTFERLLKKQNFVMKFNGKPIIPLDPFYKDTKNDLRPRDGYQSVLTHITFKDKGIPVELILIPRTDLIKGHKNFERLDIIKKYEDKPLQGLYVYRNNRLINAGGWETTTHWAVHASKRCARIVINIDGSFDDILKLDPTKTTYDIPQDFKELLEEATSLERKEWNYPSNKNRSGKASFGDSSRDKGIKPKETKIVKPTPKTINKPITKIKTSAVHADKKDTDLKHTSTVTSDKAGEQLELNFGVQKLKQADNDDLIWYDIFTNQVMVNTSHKMYDHLVKSIEDIK